MKRKVRNSAHIWPLTFTHVLWPVYVYALSSTHIYTYKHHTHKSCSLIYTVLKQTNHLTYNLKVKIELNRIFYYVCIIPISFCGLAKLRIDFFFSQKVTGSSGLFPICVPPGSAPWVLGSQACAPMLDLNCIFSMGFFPLLLCCLPNLCQKESFEPFPS